MKEVFSVFIKLLVYNTKIICLSRIAILWSDESRITRSMKFRGSSQGGSGAGLVRISLAVKSAANEPQKARNKV